MNKRWPSPVAIVMFGIILELFVNYTPDKQIVMAR